MQPIRGTCLRFCSPHRPWLSQSDPHPGLSDSISAPAASEPRGDSSPGQSPEPGAVARGGVGAVVAVSVLLWPRSPLLWRPNPASEHTGDTPGQLFIFTHKFPLRATSAHTPALPKLLLNPPSSTLPPAPLYSLAHQGPSLGSCVDRADPPSGMCPSRDSLRTQSPDGPPSPALPPAAPLYLQGSTSRPDDW